MSVSILRTSSAVLFAFVVTVTSAAVGKAEDGIVKVKSAYSVSETIERLGYRPQDDAEDFAERLDALAREG